MIYYLEGPDYETEGLVEITEARYLELSRDNRTQGPYASDGPDHPEFMVVVLNTEGEGK